MKSKQIPVEDVRIGMYVLELDRPWLGTPFRFQGFSVTSDEEIAQLRRYCRTVCVSGRDEAPRAAPKRFVATPLVRGSAVYPMTTSLKREVPVAREIYSTFEESVHQTMELVRLTGDLDTRVLKGAVAKMTRSIERNPDAMMLLHHMKQKSGDDFYRAVDNSIHMITFGRFLQFPGERLELLGLAGLLLDIGKVKLPEAILRKKDKLTPQEYELSKRHVGYSVTLIRDVAKLPGVVADIVSQHHERLDGSGYPRRLSGQQITIDGAIAGLVDSYCALIAKRDYAKQSSPSDALGMLFKQRGVLFHDALVEQLIQCIGIYPVGSAVELSTGDIGVVIAQNLIRRLQPTVMLLIDKFGKPIRPQVVVDLIQVPKSAAGEHYRIARTIPGDQLPIDLHEFFL